MRHLKMEQEGALQKQSKREYLQNVTLVVLVKNADADRSDWSSVYLRGQRKEIMQTGGGKQGLKNEEEQAIISQEANNYNKININKKIYSTENNIAQKTIIAILGCA